MHTRRIVVIVVCLLIAVSISAQQMNLQMEVSSGGSLPLGPALDEGQAIYKVGPLAQGSVSFPLVPRVGLHGLARVGFLLSGTYADQPLTVVTVAPGVEYRLQLGRLQFGAQALAGSYVGIFDGSSAVDVAVQTGPVARFLLSPRFSVGVNVYYTHLFADRLQRTLYSGLQITLGASFALGTGDQSPEIEYQNIEIRPVFPVFYSYYNDNPLGSFELVNDSGTDVRDVEVTFFVPEYMDRPKQCLELDLLASGATTEVPVYALFSREILSTTEGTKVTGQINVSYNYLGDRQTVSFDEALDVRNRNAMTWDDDRKAASFITARDEDILRFARGTASFTRDSESRIVNRTFRIAMALFRALDQYGVRYVIDPATPYESFSQNAAAEDYLQFPGQTLSFRGGDCDDLTILYSALLESVGIETAFITVPGHILLAFNSGVRSADVEGTFTNSQDVIVHGEKTWIPVEVTMVQESFLNAWREGARKWNINSREGQSELIPVRQAWRSYEPVDQPPLSARVIPFDPATIADAYQADLDQITAFQIQDRVRELERQINLGGARQALLINRLGVLYARYGLYAQARRQFQQIAGSDFQPAIINLGNLSFLDREYERALEYYQQALVIDEGNALAQLGVARASYELGDYGAADLAYRQAHESDPAAAEEFPYLASETTDDQSRASDDDTRQEAMLWGD